MKYLKKFIEYTSIIKDSTIYYERISQFIIYLRQNFPDKFDKYENIYSTVGGNVYFDFTPTTNIKKLNELLDEFDCILNIDDRWDGDLHFYHIKLDLEKLLNDDHWFFEGNKLGLF